MSAELIKQLVEALKLNRESLSNWMEIADKEDVRAYDGVAIRAADAALAAAVPNEESRLNAEWKARMACMEQAGKECTRFVVVALGYWGAGKTLKEAKRNCILEGAKAKDKMIGYWGDQSLRVTGDGRVLGDRFLLDLGEI